MSIEDSEILADDRLMCMQGGQVVMSLILRPRKHGSSEPTSTVVSPGQVSGAYRAFDSSVSSPIDLLVYVFSHDSHILF